MLRRLSVAIVTMMLFSAGAGAQAPAQQAAGEPKTIWFFYTVKWGFQDEFLDLFQRNHYPILKEMEKAGLYVSVKTFVPENHGDGRADWTFAVELVEPAKRPGVTDRSGDRRQALSGPREAAERGAAPVRAARRALGRAAQPDRPEHAQADALARTSSRQATFRVPSRPRCS